MKKALLFATVLAGFAADAQHKLLFEEKTAEAYQLKYNAGNLGDSQVQLNTIINLLKDSKAVPKQGRPPRTPEFTLRFEQQASIADAGDVLMLKVQVGKPQLSGSTDYRGFDLGDALLPDKYTAKIKLLNAKNEVVKVYEQTITLKPNGVTLLEEQVPDTAANQNFKLQVEEEQVVYTSADVRQLQEQLDLVRAYFAADADVLQALQNAAHILPDDIDHLPLQERNLVALEQQYDQLEKQNFTEKLNLNQQDPQRLKYKLNQLGQVLEERRKAMEYTFATLDQQFYNRGVSLINGGNFSGAQAYFDKSVAANPSFAPAHVQLARIDLRNGYIREATNRTRDVLTRMRIDPQTEQLALSLAHDIYSVHISEADDLLGQVKFQYYVRFIDEGKRFLAQQNYRSALSQFEEALELEQSYRFKPVQELRQLSQKAAKPVLLAMLGEGYEQAMQNRLSTARQTAADATAMQERYALVQDTEVQGKYKLLRERIFTQECMNTQAAYDEHYQKAQVLERERKFIAADQGYIAAIKAAEGSAACGIATFTATDRRTAIAAAASYQRKLEETKRLIGKNKYGAGIALYEEAKALYLAQQVNKYGLDHISLYNFARDHQKQPFTAAAVGYYADQGEEQVAVQLLTQLLEKGYRKGKTKKVQQQLGQQLAQKDVQQGEVQDGKMLAAKYSQNNRSLKHLKKAYEKTHKQLTRIVAGVHIYAVPPTGDSI